MSTRSPADTNGAAPPASGSPPDRVEAAPPNVSLRVFPLHGILPGPACTCSLGPACKSVGKHPMVRWRSYDENSRGPSGGYGIQTGQFNGIFVVDLDVGPDKNGVDALVALAAGRPIPDTLSVLTPSGGVHLYFRLPPGVHVPTSHGVLGPGIDIKGEGGFVVGPGSPHKNGGVYQEVPDHLADQPAWLLALVAQEPRAPKPFATEHRTVEPSSPEGVRAIAWAKTYLASAEPAVEGQGGSNRLFHACCHLMYSALPLDVLRQVVEEVYNPRCEPPWSTEEIEHKLVDADRVSAEPRGLCSPDFLDKMRGGTNGATSGDGAGSDPTTSETDDKAKLADQVIHIVAENAELFHDPSETAYALVTTKSVRCVLRLRSPKMHAWIARTVHADLGRSVSKNAIDQALCALEGFAVHDRDEREVHLRVAEHEGGIYIDLGDETGACIEVTAAGWRVLDAAPVLFRRPDAMRALPRPVPGGSLADLRQFVNTADEDALFMFVAWEVAAYRPHRPFTILAVHGEQGTAKSTAARVARALVDPNASPVRSAPRSEDDLAVAAVHSHVIGFDNLSGVQPWLSDALCRLATGGGLSKRTHYTNDDETVLDAIRPVIVNGIDDVATRGDLAERCLVLVLEPIPKKKRRDEEAFWRDFAAAAPRILGYLLDGVPCRAGKVPARALGEALDAPRTRRCLGVRLPAPVPRPPRRHARDTHVRRLPGRRVGAAHPPPVQEARTDRPRDRAARGPGEGKVWRAAVLCEGRGRRA
jgi:hypothetical protein